METAFTEQQKGKHAPQKTESTDPPMGAGNQNLPRICDLPDAKGESSMSNEDEKEDVDVFVSPRRFGGRTPAAKATKRKVFEEEQAAMARKSEEMDSESDFEGVKYKYDSEHAGAGESVHKAITRNDILRKVVLGANYFLAFLGLVVIAVAIWVLVQHRNGGIFSFTSKEGIILKSPIAFGVCFLIVAAGCIFTGYFIGVPHIAPSAVEGLREERRKSFIWYLVLSASTIILLCIVFTAAIYPLQTTRKFGITVTAWQRMAISHPDRICKYEINNRCAGAKDKDCTNIESSLFYKRCPGHHCLENCQATGPQAQTGKGSCSACFKSFSTASELKECKANEEKEESSRGCRELLRKDVRHFFLVIASSSGTFVGLVILVVILGTLSPIVNSI